MDLKTKLSTSHKADAFPYCATCKKNLTTQVVNDKLVGQRFLCPNWSYLAPHAAAVVSENDESARWWLRRQYGLARYQRWSSGLFEKTWMALCVQFLFLLLALLLAPQTGWMRCVAGLIASLYIVHCLLYNTSVAFVTQLPKAPLRSAVLGLIAFLELALSFAVFYLLLPNDELKVKGDFDIFTAVYFSLGTIVTLGYGDIYPKSGGYIAYFLVVSEIFAGLYFLSTLFVTMVSWASRKERLLTLQELLVDSRKLDNEELWPPSN